MLKTVVIVLAGVILHEADGHGMLTEPPSRSSVWRFSSEFLENYNDNELFCGGIEALINNKGCGLCGDDLASPRPRANENTGVYGTGRIVREYQAGQVIDVQVTLTANHFGYFQYSLCDNGDGTQPESDESCFQLLLLEDGTDKLYIDRNSYSFKSRVKLPDGLTCEHCVFRWHWKSANSWGTCEDGTGAMGCGNQETFRNCADVKIV